jgi:5-methylcytosine-specific restriction endonuclease McrA
MKKKTNLRASPGRTLPGARDRLPVDTSWREGKSTAARGYGARWQRERVEYLIANPLCVMCLELGVYVPATVVDHVTPHEGNALLFWDRGNWQGLCVTCHSKHKQKAEHALRYGR